MSDVPDDLKVTARMIAANLCSDLFPQLSDAVRKPFQFVIFDAVAAALLAERERAAKIAEAEANMPISIAAKMHLSAVVNAIRKNGSGIGPY